MQTLASGDLTAPVRSAAGFSRVITLERGFSGGSAPKRNIHIYRKVNADPSVQRPDRTCAVSNGILKGYNP